MADEETKTETKRTPDVTQSELQVAFEFKLENYYQQGNDADKKVAEGILIDELRSFVANAGSEKTLTGALDRARANVSAKNNISDDRFALISKRIQGMYNDMAGQAREESRGKMHTSIQEYATLLSDESVRTSKKPEDLKRKQDMEKAAADALRDFMRRGGDEKAVRETLADVPDVTPHFARRFTALAKMQAAFDNYGETLREHGPSKTKEAVQVKREAEAALIASLRSFAKAGGNPERMEEVLQGAYAEYSTPLEGQGSMTPYFVKRIKDLYAQEVAKEGERQAQKEAEEAAKTAGTNTAEEVREGEGAPTGTGTNTAEEVREGEGAPTGTGTNTAEEVREGEGAPTGTGTNTAEEVREGEGAPTGTGTNTAEEVREGEGTSTGTGTPVKTEDGSELTVGSREEGQEKGPQENPREETQEAPQGMTWREALEATQVHASQFEAGHSNDPNGFPIQPTKIEKVEHGFTAHLASGSRIEVDPNNQSSVNMVTKKGNEDYLPDCVTLMHASKLKGFTSINIQNGNEAFVKAMYQAAIMSDLGAKVPKEFEDKVAQWKAEAEQMMGKSAENTAENKGNAPAARQAPAQARDDNRTDSTGAGTPAGTTEQGPVEQEREAPAYAPTVEAKAAHQFTNEEKEKIGGFMDKVDRLIAERMEGGAKKFSHADMKMIQQEWEKTGIKGVTVGEVMALSAQKDKKKEGAVPGFTAAKEALVSRVCPREINEVKEAAAHQPAAQFEPTPEQKKEMVEMLQKMDKKFGKLYGAEKTDDAQEKYQADVALFAKQMQNMAARFDVKPEALATSMKGLLSYQEMTSSTEKADGTAYSKGVHIERAMETVFREAPKAKAGVLYRAKASVGKKIEATQISHAAKRARRLENNAQKDQIKEGKKQSKGLDLRALQQQQGRG